MFLFKSNTCALCKMEQEICKIPMSLANNVLREYYDRLSLRGIPEAEEYFGNIVVAQYIGQITFVISRGRMKRFYGSLSHSGKVGEPINKGNKRLISSRN